MYMHTWLLSFYFFVHFCQQRIYFQFLINHAAEEWKKIGLYFAYHVFQGIQQRKYLKHFHILVRAILILFGPQLVKRKIETASDLLKEFVQQYEVNNFK